MKKRSGGDLSGMIAKRTGRWRTTSGCKRVFAGFEAVSTKGRQLGGQHDNSTQSHSSASGIGGQLWRRLDQRQFGGESAGLQQAVTVVGDVLGLFPMEIAQMPLDGEGRMVAEQDLGGVRRFLGASELGERRRPDRPPLKMIG